jgi:hypothetical protein
MKKNILYNISLVVLLFSVFGCKKFLTKDLQGQYSASQFYQTTDQAIEAINAAYQPLNFTSATNNPLWVFGDVASDDAVKGGNPGDQPDIGLIDQFNINASNGIVNLEWINLYEGITRCNIVLAYVPAISMDTALRTRILGEAKFLRSWYYFMLVNIYGDVPVVLTPLNPNQLQIAQSPASQIYSTVIQPGLRDAINQLPPSYQGPDIGRVTSGAATALLAESYLYQQNWDSAMIYSLEVISSGRYSLMPIYRQDFDADHKNNPESVFEVQMLSGQVPATGNALNQWFAPAVDNGYYFDAPTQSFVDEFEKSDSGNFDPRLDYTIGRDSMPWFNGETFSSLWTPTGYLTRKYQQPFSEIPINLKGDGSCNYLAIRYADVLLWYAESLNESGLTTQALVPLNQVRKRARESYLNDSTLAGFGSVPAGLLPDVVYTDQPDVRAAIQHERRVEFGFEFHRYFDVIRWGATYANQVMSNSPGFNYNNDKRFPIPQFERDTDKALH